MRDALDEQRLMRALGTHRVRLLNPADLQRALLEAEISLFSGSETAIAPALDTAWFLHALAVAPPGDDSGYEVRRGDAARVAAHIFDLFLQQTSAEDMSPATRLRFVVAAQSGYHVGGVSPNAIALGRSVGDTPFIDIRDDPGQVSLTSARLFLTQDLRTLGAFLDSHSDQEATDVQGWGPTDESPFAAARGVLAGVASLRQYLLSGNAGLLAQARDLFASAIRNPFSAWDADSRWTAALLADFGSALSASSVWSVLPPDTPLAVGRALTLADPPIYTLWPPQAEFLRSTPSPFERSSRRMVLSLPTSAGKTLIAQILTVTFLASSEQDVCVIAPTHALCREIRQAFETRLAMLRTHAHDGGPVGAPDPLAATGRVLVVTPERFAAMLRSDPEVILERFGLFIVDEVHLLSERQRGWQLEETLSALHHLTRDTDHQLILVSAAMGHAAHTRQWLTLDTEPIANTTQWRGPRRLHAIYGTEFVPGSVQVEPKRGTREARQSRDIRGKVYLSGPNNQITAATFGGTAGTVVRRQTKTGAWVKDDASTKQIFRLLPLVSHLVRDTSTTCLVVVAQRREARELAAAVSEMLPLSDASAGLAERLASRLPAQGLADLARYGVAYHHGLLPSDVQADIERAAAAGQLRCVVSTTTLTEGVNLPFKAVVIGSRGWGSGAGFEEIIDAPRLLNAFGRAGRACRETEGWLFMAIQEPFNSQQFNQFEWDPSAMDLRSTLTTPEALEALAAFEALLAAGTDAVLADESLETLGFCSYVWFLAEILGQLRGSATLQDTLRALQDTLAWRQLEPDQIAGWERVATESFNRYDGSPPDRRRRWGRSGTSIPTSAVLEAVSEQVAAAVPQTGDDLSYTEWIDLILRSDVLQELLHVSENPTQRGFKPYLTAARTNLIDVDLRELVLDWISGVELDEIARRHLSAISDEDYRSDALSEFTAGVLEHHLPWMLSTLIVWVNEKIAPLAIPRALPIMLQYGISQETALHLMTNGVRSRRLAHRIAGDLGEVDLQAAREQLQQLTIAQWRDAFDASPAELGDLLSFVSDPDQQPVSDLLDGQAVIIAVELFPGVSTPAVGIEVSISEASGALEPPPLFARTADQSLGYVATEHHSHVNAIRQLGLPVRAELGAVQDNVAHVAISLEG